MIGQEYRLRYSPTTQGFQWKIESNEVDEINDHDWVTIAKGSEEKLTLFMDAVEGNYVRSGTRKDVERLWRIFEMGYQRRYIE